MRAHQYLPFGSLSQGASSPFPACGRILTLPPHAPGWRRPRRRSEAIPNGDEDIATPNPFQKGAVSRCAPRLRDFVSAKPEQSHRAGLLEGHGHLPLRCGRGHVPGLRWSRPRQRHAPRRPRHGGPKDSSQRRERWVYVGCGLPALAGRQNSHLAPRTATVRVGIGIAIAIGIENEVEHPVRSNTHWDAIRGDVHAV
jgi:hypothetical protein